MSDQINEQITILKEIVKWVRFSGFSQVKDALQITLENDKKILAYHLSDGGTTSIVISQKTGISQPRVTELWKEWLVMGLGESIKSRGGSRFKRSFDLNVFGITIPEIKNEKLSESK